jgi:putative transcriptional regulator
MLDKSNMTVKDFADKAGIAYNTALSLKRGSSTRIDFDTLDKICDLFSCTPGDLIVKSE